jgi:predicted site-specific integrase-resolvase
MLFAVVALVKIGKAAEMMGVTPQTLLAWERSGELVPARRSAGGVRYYDLARIPGLGNGLGTEEPTIGYARVPGPGLEASLTQQEELLEAFCSAKGWRHEVISDSGSGSGYSQKGLKRLIELILHKRMNRLVVTHKDRLSRFGSELIFTLCEQQNVEVVITNKGDPPSLGEEESLARDEIEIRQLCDRLINGDRALSAPMPDPKLGGLGKP